MTSETSNFDLFMILFDNPKKIRLSFYSNHQTAIAFMEALFKYLDGLNEQLKDPSLKDWIISPMNVSNTSQPHL